MTLILAVNGRETIWLLADRRLSAKGREPKDGARKVMFLETTDGVAILGYAGLGATALGTEPADWMSAVLRSRNLPLEQSLGILAEAMKKQLPRHLIMIQSSGGPTHNVVIPALVEDKVRLYSIDLSFSQNRKSYNFRYTRHVVGQPTPENQRTPRIGMAGTGALHLIRDKSWIRPLLSLVKASDQGKSSPQVVSNYLARVNYKVSLGIEDQTVGPRCIVAWQNRKKGCYKGGGGHHFYTKDSRDKNTPSLPTIGNGMDIEAITRILMPPVSKMLVSMLNDGPTENLDEDKLNEDLSRLPDAPDEELR
jgi:hypothetical protein